MPVLTDPRQIVSPLPASLIKEIPDGTRSKINCGSTKKPSRTRTDKRKTPTPDSRAESRLLDTEGGERTDSSEGASPSTEGRIIRDIWPGKYLVEAHACWSLSKSKEFHGELPAMSAETKELVLQEAILWAARERDRDKWMAFE